MGDSEQVEWKFMKLYLTDIVKTISNKSATRRSKRKPVAYHEEQQPEVATPQSSERQLRTPQRNSRRQSPRTRSSVLKEQERGFSPVSGSGEESDKEATPPKRRNGISSSKKTRTKSPSKDCDDCSGAESGEQLEESTKRKCKYSNSKKKRTNIHCKKEDNDNLSDEQTVVASPRKRRRQCSDFDVFEAETEKYNTVSELEVEDVVEEETEVASASKRRKQRSPPQKPTPRGEDKAERDHYELGEQAEDTTPSRKCSESKKVRTRTPSEDVVEVESAHFKTEEHAAAEDTTLRKRQRRSKKSKKKRSKSPPKEASDTESDGESGKHISKTWPKDFHEEERDQDAKTRSKDLSEQSDQGSQTESKDLSEEEWHCSDHSEKETEHEVLPAKRKRGPKSKKTMKSDSENVTVKKNGKKQGAMGLKAPRIRFTPPVEKRIRVKTLHICSFCEKVLPNRAALRRHLQHHTGEKPYHCEECGKDYGSKTTLKIHNMQVHHKGTKDFICNECDQQFTHLTYLKRHMYSHTDKEKRPHLCNVCGKHFIQKSHLDRHKMIHTGEKPFSCEHCAVAFNRPEYLRMHLKLHVSGSEGPNMAEQEKTKCTECSKSFVNPKYLNIHMRMHTGERPYKCEHCAKSFTQTSILNAHRRTHTGEKPHKCKSCGSCFTRRRYLDDHIGRKHWSLQQMKEQEDEQ
ncbi:zinc finger protein 37-like [Oncorhynchus tshawytscha]|uniref:zinc finger protein 37-like n=1 Tax=Oncorhynchus tshawytscha TaxID=74940 RepID=UPI000D09CE95|nr:zinc finger protein 37-like [Oncorhynchus tshawytscha]